MTALVLQVDADLAPHVARALSTHLAWCRTNGVTVPDGLAEVLKWSQVVARGLSSPPALDVTDDVVVEPLILTIPQVAELLGCGQTKVKTLVDAGQLPVVDFGGVRRVRRADVDAFIEKLAAGTSFREHVEVKSDPADSGRRLEPTDTPAPTPRAVTGSATRNYDGSAA